MTTQPGPPDDLAADVLVAAWPPGKVILISETNGDHAASWLLIPALGRLKQPERWMTWIAPPHKPSSEFLRANGINPRHLRIIHQRTRRERLRAAEQALASPTNDIVLVWMAECTDHDLDRLTQAAQQALTCGMLIDHRNGVPADRNKSRPTRTTAADEDPPPAGQLGLQLD